MYQKSASQGNIAAQHNIENIYNDGEGVPKNFNKAAEWFEKAAIQGYVDAQYNLGVLYRDILGFDQDHIKAKKWFKLACDNGDTQGCGQYITLNQ